MNARTWIAAAAIAVGLPAAWAAIWTACSEQTRYVLLAHVLYWLMPPCVAFAAFAAWRRLGARTTPWRTLARDLWPGALLATALSAVVFTSVTPELRVQFDETSLIGVSQNMHEQRLAVMTTGALPTADGLLRLENMPDKRPPLFPFLLSVLHDVTGSRIENAFVVNALLLAAGLFTAFAAARRLGLAAAAAAPLLLLGVPLVSIVATSAGFGLLAAVLFGIVLFAAVDFVRAPDSRRWTALLGCGVLFAASRYESLPALLSVGALALWMGRGRWRPDRAAVFATALVPGLLAPLVLQMQHARDPNFYPEAGGQALLSLQHFAAHVPPFVARCFDPALANPLPGVLAIAGVLAWIVWLLRRRGGRIDVLIGAPIAAVTAVVLAWFIGDANEPIALRLFLPVSCALALLPLLLVRLWGVRAAVPLLVAAAGLAALRVQAVRAHDAFPRLESVLQSEAVDRIVDALGAPRATTLWVGTPAQHLVVMGHAALSPSSFVARGADLRVLMRSGEIAAIYVLETPFDAVMAPAVGDPRDVLRTFRSEVVAGKEQEPPLRVHRLAR